MVGVASHADRRAEEASKGEASFVDIMASIERKSVGKSKRFTFTDILQCANLLLKILMESVVDTVELPLG